MNLKTLIGSGDKIGKFVLPFLIFGLVLNIFFPNVFSVGGPPEWLIILSVILIIPGIIIWMWSVILILLKVPEGSLITNGPYRLVKHPLYTGVSFLVLPSIGFLLNSWLGVLIGLILYTGSKIYSPQEEKVLAETFGKDWEVYCQKVLLPWV